MQQYLRARSSAQTQRMCSRITTLSMELPRSPTWSASVSGAYFPFCMTPHCSVGSQRNGPCPSDCSPPSRKSPPALQPSRGHLLRSRSSSVQMRTITTIPFQIIFTVISCWKGTACWLSWSFHLAYGKLQRRNWTTSSSQLPMGITSIQQSTRSPSGLSGTRCPPTLWIPCWRSTCMGMRVSVVQKLLTWPFSTCNGCLSEPDPWCSEVRTLHLYNGQWTEP